MSGFREIEKQDLFDALWHDQERKSETPALRSMNGVRAGYGGVQMEHALPESRFSPLVDDSWQRNRKAGFLLFFFVEVIEIW
jgi:hypothetical protein